MTSKVNLRTERIKTFELPYTHSTCIQMTPKVIHGYFKLKKPFGLHGKHISALHGLMYLSYPSGQVSGE